MSENQAKALAILGLALIAGAIVQGVIRHEATVLGLSAVEIALLGAAIGGAVHRRMA